MGRSLTDYAGTAANLINEVKERGRTQLLNWIVEQFDAIELGKEVVLVAMPSSRAAWRSRGFVPAEELAGRLARRRLLKHEVRALSLTREAADQVPLNRAQRNENRHGSMVSRPISGQVLIVDDVVTSGASLREAKRAIEAAGGEVVGFITFAQTILENRANRS